MPSVKGSIALCSSPRSLVCDEQGIGKFPLWKKYDQLMTIVSKYLPMKYQTFFAKPVEVQELEDNYLEWYAQVSSMDANPRGFFQLTPSEREKYIQIKDETIAAYRSAIDQSKAAGNASDAEHLEKAMKYVGDFDDYFYCFEDRVVVVVWGMRPRDISQPMSGVINKLINPNITHTATFDLGLHGTSGDNLKVNKRLNDSPIQQYQIPSVLANEGYKFIGWDKEPFDFKVIDDVTFTAQYEQLPRYTVVFDLGEHGDSSDILRFCKYATDDPIRQEQIPQVHAKEGYRFIGWNIAPLNFKVNEDVTFVALYEQKPAADQEPNSKSDSNQEPETEPVLEPEEPHDTEIYYRVRFEDENGNEMASCSVREGDIIPTDVIPSAPVRDHQRFIGWGNNLQTPVHEDRVYRLKYEPIPLSWWERFKLWWKEKGCLKRLLRLLLLLLLLLLLILLLKDCNGCSGLNGDGENNYTGGNPFIPNDPGNSGIVEEPLYPPIPDNDSSLGILPEHPNQPVPIDDGDIIDDEDGYRRIVGNRLNVLLDDETLTINDFAVDFKHVYSGDQYQIIYADPIVKRLQLMVPADERVQIKQEMIGRLPSKYNADNVFIWDEALMTGTDVPNDSRIGECWYHNAIKSYTAWNTTMGKEDVVIAVVDDGFDVNHDEFNGKIIKPYNVYDKSTNVRESKDKHGTHVAGLALASANNREGIAGVAPNCKLMPIKVFDDNGYTSTLPVIDGVLYAMYNGADVVNLSLGMNFFSNIPVPVQKDLIRSSFKEEERVWKKVFSMANRNNTAIVIAAGNENLLAGIEPMHRSENVIVVAAVDQEHNPMYTKSNFSNYGEYTDVSAPGVNILSTVGRNKYAVMSGTSMAAPLVTGAVALIKSINRPLSTPQIKKILQETGIAVNGNIGPLIQLDKAIEKAKNTNANLIETHPEPSTGSVQILLEWHNYNDLDLICKDPAGDIVWFKRKKVPSGGQLEIDMNAGSQYSSNPIENIYWPQGGAPNGHYSVYVSYYKRHDTQQVVSDYKVTIRYGDNKRTFKGTARTESEMVEIYSFDFNN